MLAFPSHPYSSVKRNVNAYVLSKIAIYFGLNVNVARNKLNSI